MKKKDDSRFQVGSLTEQETMSIVRAKQKMIIAINYDAIDKNEHPTDKALLMFVVGYYLKESK